MWRGRRRDKEDNGSPGLLLDFLELMEYLIARFDAYVQGERKGRPASGARGGIDGAPCIVSRAWA